MSIEIIDSDLELDYQAEEETEKRASLEHGLIGAVLSSYLVQHVLPNKLGGVFDAQTSFKVLGNPPTRQPDVAFVRASRLPATLRKQADFAPDLAVEIVSESDKTFDTEAKILQYQQSGVALIWIVYPVTKTVEVYRLSQGLRSQRLFGEDELDGEAVIPGFKLALNKLFDYV